ncbi:MAG: hypothetical protein LBS53_04800 [Synergistaceae bacterium]|nr:hypothetical protein [Synergistaceae bacterium]
MSVKSLRGILLSVLAATMLLVLSSSVWAASALIDPDNAAGGKKGGDYEMERVLDGGITVVCLGVSKESDNDLLAHYEVIVEEDMVIKLNPKDMELFDTSGNKFTARASYIGNDRVESREIVSGIRNRVLTVYDPRVNSNYKVDTTFPRLSFSINGKKLIFRDVPAIN